MTAKSKTEFRFVGAHAGDLADGRILEPGALYTLTEEEQADPHNRAHLDGGLLIPTKPDKEGD